MSKRRRKQGNKSDIPLFILIIVMFIIGAGVMIYPDVASWFASRSHAGLVEQYQHEIADIPDEEVLVHFERARNYNKSLVGGEIEDPFVPGSGFVVPNDYYEILNMRGVMGVIEIPAIDVFIPIFHGTGEEVLMRGVGHIPVTPFPIGQMDKHAVLTGHTGIPTSRLFTDLEFLEIGDIFIVSVLNERMAYQIDDINVVLPNEVSSLRNVVGQDLITLVTCTPYAINTHRLLVRGHRIPYIENMEEEVEVIVTSLNWRIILIVAISALFIFGWLVYSLKNKKKKRNKKKTVAK